MRASRVRLATLVLGVLFGIVFGLYLLWRIGEWTLDLLVYENPSFAIQTIDIQTDGVVSPHQLCRWSGVKPGQNLLALDIGAVKRNLELASVVKTVAVERVLPSTLRIRVTEREPIAQINVPRPRPGGGMDVVILQLDADGCVLQPVDPRQRVAALNELRSPLPVLTGLSTADLQLGRRIENPQVQAAMELITAFKCSSMAGLVDLSRVDVGYPEVLVATTGQGSEVTIGPNDLNQQLLRWRQLLDVGLRMNKVIASLDLAVTNNVPVTWLDASSVPASTPKPQKTHRNGKTNV